MDIEALMNLEVTSVSRRPEKLSQTASAIQVITGEDIRRSGATRLPEALRLASNLAVDQLDASQWAISARGFNSPLANKLLVLIDGRTVYSPLFAGVFWDVQDVLLEDVERIEVISGPGGTLWGANAVNGVINIITKSAKASQGAFLGAGGGTEVRAFGRARYGGALASNLYGRAYGKYSDYDGKVLADGRDANNDWHMGQGGGRLDWEASEATLFTLQGDLYENRLPLAGPDDIVTRGANVMGRWSHTLSEASHVKLQGYVDRMHRNIPGQYDDVLYTYDLDFQHRFALGARHAVVWGTGYRRVADNFAPGALALVSRRVSLETFSAFVQDEMALSRDRLHLTLGTKVEHNDYTGLEVQPHVRLVWLWSQQQTLWAAVSRAVRTPSRLDRDLVVLPGRDFDSEKLLAYEGGYRAQPHEQLAVSLAVFYHDYDDLRSVEQVDPPVPFVVGNGQAGASYGAELWGDYRPAQGWRLRAGYTAMRVDIRAKPGSTDRTSGASEAADSDHNFSVRSSLDLPAQVEFDTMFRYVSRLRHPSVPVPGYAELDIRLAWRPTPTLEFSVVGQNLLHARHAEFGDPGTRQEIERGVYGKVTWRR